MADVKIIDLPEASSISNTDDIIVEQADGTKKAAVSLLPAGVPDGGTQGQVLTKQSALDGDADWETIVFPTVDQTYGSSSSNAQSGTAVAEAVAEAVDELKVLVITSSSFSSLPQTISNTAITESHVVINSVLSNPSAQTGDWTVTTSNGSLTISGSISGSTTVTLYLALS